MWTPGGRRSPAPNPRDHSDSHAPCPPLARCAPLHSPHRPAPPRAGTWAARWEAVSSRLYLGGSLPDAPRRRRQSPPSRSRAKNSPPFQTTASHCRTIASVVGIPSPARPPPRTHCPWAAHLSSTHLPCAIWTQHHQGPPSGYTSHSRMVSP